MCHLPSVNSPASFICHLSSFIVNSLLQANTWQKLKDVSAVHWAVHLAEMNKTCQAKSSSTASGGAVPKFFWILT